MKWRKKPVIIEAIQYTVLNGYKIQVWSNDKVIPSPVLEPTDQSPTGDYLQVKTLEGIMTAVPGDWIIRGVNGEYYPCKPDIFEKTYEAADESSSPVEQRSAEEIAEQLQDLFYSVSTKGGQHLLTTDECENLADDAIHICSKLQSSGKEKIYREALEKILEKFGRWCLSNELAYEKGKNPTWGKISYSEKVKGFLHCETDGTWLMVTDIIISNTKKT